ncbi:MAG TPA: DUF5686 and carboxypeptidase regulatory-like domain-containing protein [Ferruginibacter sp.]|nr:DUF5686 and carboxypeptidase regulatory-like domain-containing protein [Ferruginibacter sp.]
MPRALLFLFLLAAVPASAQKIYGTVFTATGDLLPFSSITIKGTSIGASANEKGKYSFTVTPGTYVVVCQHVGYKKQESKVTITKNDEEITFILARQDLDMTEVVVKKGEDPAYAIIRQAIRKRSYYNEQVKAFECDLYSKDMLKLRNLPKKILGRKISEQDRSDMGVDSAGKGIIYLSESVSRVYSQLPDKLRLEVISSRVSGSDGFGFTFPTFISFYQNNVSVFLNQLNPRGFVSPIADNALSIYKYKFLGSFFEDGKEINSIQVIPRRLYEPAFSGIINITEGDWRIHSLNLKLTKTSQLEIVDTLEIDQIHVPVGGDVWRSKNQLIHFSFKQFGIDAIGNFVTVYSNYLINPTFAKNRFNNVIIRYDTAVNKRSKEYWDTIRPVPLEVEERMDYEVKDSLFEMRKDSLLSQSSIDSLKKKQGKLKPLNIFWKGIQRTHYSKTNTYNWGIESLIKGLEYNTVEGVVVNLNMYFDRHIPKWKTNVSFEPSFRYGFNNTHLNAWATLTFRTRDWETDKKIRRQTWEIGGGKRVSQFNKQSQLLPLNNTINTLLWGDNFMKIYENYFLSLGFSKRFESGFRLSISTLYEDRRQLNNTTDFTVFKDNRKNITANYPVNSIPAQFFDANKAFILSIDMSFRPGQRYIQYPNRKMSLGSKYPTFSLNYTKGIKGIFGSDANFDKWRFSVADGINLKLAGTFRYKLGIGGFITNRKVFIQDFQHFNGNRSTAASEYVNSYQLAPYYINSNTEPFFSFGHIEHHFNGMLTNKIPLFRRLNWNLVVGSNAYYVNRKNHFVEAFFGLENILKLFRVDYVFGYTNNHSYSGEIRIGAGGLLGNSVRANAQPRRRNASLSIGL